MKSFIISTVVVLALGGAMVAASAGERENEAFLGAGSGLLVGGPVGLVAGGVIGYVAGPDIRRGMDVDHHRHVHQRHAYRDYRNYH